MFIANKLRLKKNKLFLVILLRMYVRVCGCAVESEQAGKYLWESVSVL